MHRDHQDRFLSVVTDWQFLAFLGFCCRGDQCFADGVPNDFQFQLFDEDWDHFSILMKYSPPLLFFTKLLGQRVFPIDVSFVDSSALERCPALETAEVRQLLNGPESFTPDNQVHSSHTVEIYAM
jgi:hypothetical protein